MQDACVFPSAVGSTVASLRCPPKGPVTAGLFRAVTFTVKFNNIGQFLFRGLEWTTIAHSILNLCYVVGLYDETFHVEMKPTFVLA